MSNLSDKVVIKKDVSEHIYSYTLPVLVQVVLRDFSCLHFYSSQMSPVSVNGLKALCSLGLLQGDTQLCGAVVQELAIHAESNIEHLADYAMFCAEIIAMQASYFYIFDGLKIIEVNNNFAWEIISVY